jgi:DNA-binding PadR family transcriptional regulator
LLSKTAIMVMGLLAEGERHGYELVREMDLRGMLRWTRASKVGVYKALARLEEEGCLTSWTEREGRQPEKRVYALTVAGEQRLQELVYALCASEEPIHMEMPVGLAFVSALDREEARQALEARQLYLRRQLKRLGRERELTAGVGDKVDEQVRRYEIALYREEARLLGGVIEVLAGGEAEPHGERSEKRS